MGIFAFEILLFVIMRNRLPLRIFLFVALNCLCLFSLSGQTQKMIRPMQRPVILSGNFGELRATHFHSGIDIKTGGVTGIPVVCVKDGLIARVRVSPVGYGNALYVEHGDGTTTVYGHLERFAPCIERLVRELQYCREDFGLDEDFRAYALLFKQGDTIAYSGNSGSSGGPHLHFEIRDTRTEKVLNPLSVYKIRDAIPPLVKTVYIYNISEEGCVESVREISVKSSGAGRYSVGQVTVPAGKIGIGVHAEDRMNDSGNKLGVYKMDLTVAGDTLFRLKMDSCDFGESCYINTIKDFYRYKKRETVYRCFGWFQNNVTGVENFDGGVFEIQQDSNLALQLDLWDINGNRAKVNLTLKGGRERGQVISPDSVLRFDCAYRFFLPEWELELKPGMLPWSVKQEIGIEADSNGDGETLVLSREEVPLMKKAVLSFIGKYGEKALICEEDAQGRLNALETRREEGRLSAVIGYLSRYRVVEDTVPPTVTFLGITSGRRVSFKIKDDLSGIGQYRGEVNGEWCLFVYDAKNDLFSCSLNEPVFKTGETHLVKVKVCDRAGNCNEYIVNVKK